MSKESEPPIRAWVLYDGSCGFCSHWVPRWETTLRARGIGIAPLQSDWVRARLPLSDEEIASDIRLLKEDGGDTLRGADVYRYAMRRIWWAWPLYLFAVLPISRQIFDWAYRTFARNRHRVSTLCGLPNRTTAGQ